MKYLPPTVLLLTLCGCGSAGAQIGAEIASKALEAAMTPSRSSAQGPPCRNACDAGTVCDELSDTCVPEQVRTMEDYERVASGATAATGKPARPPVREELPEDESCGGFCLSSEICRVRIGSDVECVPRPRDR